MSKKRYQKDEINQILEEYKNGASIESIIEKYGISQATFYNWRSKYSGLAAEEIVRHNHQKEDIERLKLMFADLMLENLSLKAKLRKKKEH